MLLRIRHEIGYSYPEPARAATRRLLLTPRSCAAQQVFNWRIEIGDDCRLYRGEDAFGNIEHRFSLEGPFDVMTIVAKGEVETFDVAGVTSGAVERFPPELYLRDTPLTLADEKLNAFAQDAAGTASDALGRLHATMAALHAAMRLEDDATDALRPAADAFAARAGDAKDFAQVFIACARALGVPARYVSGYLYDQDRDAVALHGWAEAYVESLSWVGFDASRKICPDAGYVRLAAALDSMGAAPIRGAQSGGGQEGVNARLELIAARSQSQSQG